MRRAIVMSIATLAMGIVSPVAFANKPAPASPCGMVENASISVSFNGIENDVAIVKSKFDGKIQEINQLAKDAALDKFELQSMNYSIQPAI